MASGAVLLKEWASAVEALLAGETVMALRKGGIREETREFQLTSDSFLFFPTYEHQKEHLLKEPFRHLAESTRQSWNPEDRQVRIQAFAHAVEDLLITDEERLKCLSPYHIWTDSYAEERLHWKRAKPLHCLLLRVYALERPLVIEHAPEFAGCKSWLQLPQLQEAGGMRPVLTDEEFAAKTVEIKQALQRCEKGQNRAI